MDTVYGDVIKWRSQWELFLKVLAIVGVFVPVMAYFHVVFGSNAELLEGMVSIGAICVMPTVHALNKIDLRAPKNAARVFMPLALGWLFGLIQAQEPVSIAFIAGVFVVLEVYALAVYAPILHWIRAARNRPKQAKRYRLYTFLGLGLTLPISITLLMPRTYQAIASHFFGEDSWSSIGVLVLIMFIVGRTLFSGKTYYDEYEKQP